MPDPWAILDMLTPLLVAALMGGLIGLEREFRGRWAGLRTHMMVCLGSAAFVSIWRSLDAPTPDLSRVIQGIATGMGFIGGGTILKLSDRLEVKGLTTASSLWLAAAVGTASGVRLYPLAFGVTFMAIIVLRALGSLEKYFPPPDNPKFDSEHRQKTKNR